MGVSPITLPQRINICIAVFTAIAAIAAAIGVGVAANAAKSAARSVLQGQLTTQMSQYVDAYTRLFQSTPLTKNALEQSDYKDLTNLQKPTQQVGSLLVSVVDLMFEAHDRRAPQWAGYFKEMLGPLCDGHTLVIYARKEDTEKAIKTALTGCRK